jgi:tetrahydromethanopterin S-methyltransferase subunit G
MADERLHTLSETASKIQYTGAGSTILFGLTLNDWGILVGIVIGTIGLLVNIYFKRKQYRLTEAYLHSKLKHRPSDIPDGLEKYLGDD